MFLDIHKKPIIKQSKIIENTFDEWKGHYNQIDDVLVIDIKI